MPFWRLYYHLTWATKNREATITPSVETVLFPYMVSKAAEVGGFVYAIDGWNDHVHVVVAVPPSLAVSDFVKTVKGASSHLINSMKLMGEERFEWQEGYGAHSIGERNRAVAEAYVAAQKQHHREQTAVAWLERSTEDDEEPTDLQRARAGVVREASPVYHWDEEALF